jgi:Ca2+/Na+ antiporter
MLLLLGLTVLAAGEELLVRGASRIAMVCGVSPLVIGLTVVAFGTSTPEAAVSVFSSLQGAPGVAVGNVMGSNIFNILVDGASAMARRLGISDLVIGLTIVAAGTSLPELATSLIAGVQYRGPLFHCSHRDPDHRYGCIPAASCQKRVKCRIVGIVQ